MLRHGSSDSGRRSFMGAAAAVGVDALLPRLVPAQQLGSGTPALITRPIPASGERLPAIGVISHPAITCAIPGSTQLSHLVDNQGAGRGRLPDESMRRRMEQYWDNPHAG